MRFFRRLGRFAAAFSAGGSGSSDSPGTVCGSTLKPAPLIAAALVENAGEAGATRPKLAATSIDLEDEQRGRVAERKQPHQYQYSRIRVGDGSAMDLYSAARAVPQKGFSAWS